MADEGIVETSKATIVKRTPVDFNIEVPFVGSDMGDDLGTETSRVSGVRRSKFVTKQGVVVKEYLDELDYQDLTPLKGSATEAVIKEQEAADNKSAWDAVVEWGQAQIGHLSNRLHKAQEDTVRADYESSVEARVDKMAWERVKKSDKITTMAQATADIWLERPDLYEQFIKEREQRRQFVDITRRESKQ